jgi:hypothetical protein
MKAKKNNFHLLNLSVFFHLLSCFCSIYFDFHKPNFHLNEINYWWYFLCWWSAQTSLITIIYFIYRLFKKSPPNYFDKVFDLIVINANITSIALFSAGMLPLCWGGKPWIPAPSKSEGISVFSFVVDRKVFWWFYSIVWHYLAPIFAITYFARRKTSLAKTYYERKWLFLYSFIHPLLYITFVFYRPLIAGAKNYPCSSKCEYPYVFFKWVADFGKSSNFIWGLLFIFFIFFALTLVWFTTLVFWWHIHHKIKPKPQFSKKKLVRNFSLNKK